MDFDKYEDIYKELSTKERSYLENRLDDQIKWYDSKSMLAQKRYKKMRLIIIISSSLIPFLVAFSDSRICLKVIIGLLGVLITTSEGILNVNKDQELWIEYRSICETLQHEKHMYLFQSGVYDESEKQFEFFVERVESIISKENVNWANLKYSKRGNRDE